MITWAAKIQETLDENEDKIVWAVAQIQRNDTGEGPIQEGPTLALPLLQVKFDDGFGGAEGAHFTVWGEKFIYFPGCCEGAEWVGSVSRWPGPYPTEHQGG